MTGVAARSDRITRGQAAGWRSESAGPDPRDSLRSSRGLTPRDPVAGYFEHTFPRQAQASGLARAVGLDILIAFDISGPDGGQWSCRWEHGELLDVRRGIAADAAVVYRTDVATFAAIIDRRQSPQHAFFAQRISIEGDLETALKLVVLFDQFLREQTEVADAAVA